MTRDPIKAQKHRELDARWQRLSQLLGALQKQRDLENRADEILRLDQRIADVEADRAEVEEKVRASQPSSAGTIEVFYSYAHEDEALRDELDKHLKLLERQGILRGWHDRSISPGSEWDREIDQHLRSADVILLLVSADFIASDYVWGKELELAMARHEAGEARVIPVILRPVDWTSAPFGKLQALPKNGQPVVSWPTPDEAFTDVARGIRRVAEQMAVRRP